MGRTKQEVSIIDSNEYIRDNTYRKSNILIAAKYQSTLLENKLLAVSLAHSDEFYEDVDEKSGKPNGVWVSKLKASFIRNILGVKGGSFYQRLSETANLMTTRNFGYVDPEKKTFDYITLVMRARYINGYLYLYYNPYIKNYLKEVKKNFTEFNLKIMVGFKSEYSFRLYELIKSQCYHINQVPKHDNTYMFSFSLSELMFDLGIIDADSNDVIPLLRDKQNPDYEKAATKAKARKKLLSSDWSEFKRNVLEVAIKEINENEDINMHLTYDSVSKGKGKKITHVIFTAIVGKELLTEDQIEEKNKVLSEEEKEDFLDDLSETIHEKLRIKDLRAIAEAANYNMPVIEEKYRLSKTQKIDNFVAWMIAAINNDYAPAVSVINSTKNFVNMPNFFDSTNYEEMESLLIDN